MLRVELLRPQPQLRVFVALKKKMLFKRVTKQFDLNVLVLTRRYVTDLCEIKKGLNFTVDPACKTLAMTRILINVGHDEDPY